jgi:hypothetical protein
MSVSRSGFPGDLSWSGPSSGGSPPVPAAPDCDDRYELGLGEQPSRVDVLIGGFSVWLTRQDVTPARRDVYLTHAERFLRWQAGRPDLHTDRTLSRYTSLLRGCGQVSEVDLATTALSLLGWYRVAAPRAGWACPTSSGACLTASPIRGSFSTRSCEPDM